ncbi:MAG: 50S ribosomal protein L15 [Ignavibacteriota bacterium]|jgi:large subunit ribosomal protein L15|nr:MAG: 50S ribosomal protein L15 [Chlorobiota bacterium]MBE7476965.1 50S ribosomal protein L15 [Ignavibacteriales bacterium]MBL1121785.1 50S ribosomal protein L15 [Ignavibacteriota bacterium]MBV6419848.1 50S ribosomal protein L15 [Ignavibacteriaceae bacterium]MCE7855325.1 50S ribosomal protein L15 [Ignavibacteria bacterium CHB3]MEB2295620.1 50S ribosomal protein L15 [Ignavibacteria bacterium]
MDILSNLKYAEGSRKKRKRVGRGEGSGHGGQATRGMNGQGSRSGSKKKPWFEGGQMPLQRRIPKFGFTNIFKETYQIVNLNALQRVADANKLNGVINIAELKNLGLISSTEKPVKILGKGELKVKLNLEVNAISQSAKEKIESAGGSIKLI